MAFNLEEWSKLSEAEAGNLTGSPTNRKHAGLAAKKETTRSNPDQWRRRHTKGDGNMASYGQRLQLEVVFWWDDAKWTIESIEVTNDPAELDPGQKLALAGALIQQAKDWVETTGVTGVGKDTSDERDDEETQ
jgi:hypothetical protein